MIRNWRFAALAALAVPAAVVAQEAAAPKPDLAKAQQTATQVCAACHGADGNSATAANPNLAGQHADYITVQLAHFKAGIRVNPIMQGMAATLSDADMHALGVYFSQQKPKGLTAKDPALVKVAQKLYRGGDEKASVPACAACHSPTGAGNQLAGRDSSGSQHKGDKLKNQTITQREPPHLPLIETSVTDRHHRLPAPSACAVDLPDATPRARQRDVDESHRHDRCCDAG